MFLYCQAFQDVPIQIEFHMSLNVFGLEVWVNVSVFGHVMSSKGMSPLSSVESCYVFQASLVCGMASCTYINSPPWLRKCDAVLTF